MSRWLENLNLRIRKHRPAAFVLDIINVYLDRRVNRGAAELAYYLILTIFPMIIMVINIVGMLPLSEAQVMGSISRILPVDSADMVTDYVTYVHAHRSMSMFTAGLLTTVISASAAFRGLVSISGEIYCRKAFRGVWSLLFSWLFSLLLLVMIYISMLVVLTGNWFLHLVQNFLPPEMVPHRWRLRHWPTIRMVLLFAIAMLFLILLYRITAPRGTPGSRPPVVLGACIAAALLTLSSFGFSALISFSSRYSLVYGSLASLIILLVWLYLCGNLLILGNVFNYVYWQHRQGLPVEYILQKNL